MEESHSDVARDNRTDTHRTGHVRCWRHPLRPTALLPSQGVRWEAIDDSSAKATLTDGSTTVSMVVHFDVDGLISSISTSSRYYGDVNGAHQFAPWQGRFQFYEKVNGIRIPTEGEAVWDLPAGPLPYWSGRITEIGYEFAR